VLKARRTRNSRSNDRFSGLNSTRGEEETLRGEEEQISDTRSNGKRYASEENQRLNSEN